MPKAVAMRKERRAVFKLFVELSRELRESVYNGRDDKDWDDITTVVVACAVGVGHIEGKPMGATKIGHYTDIPRTTVMRKLKRLTEIGTIAEVPGHGRDRPYKLALMKWQDAKPERINGYRRVLAEAYGDLEDLLAPKETPK
ncbi:hypothetical protein IVA80_10970 [Bradyrhizobium sp. 139]|uniref:hypothetical protein n=1 Tax=Bradyrhizobium sp. 139 TaxID=2782616 RepID=UPI001FFA933F|nr:hypothetical protein [Bradyrhizobium sp. 139]MCK1741372.1 hypothetical protein [Bradyrhizobium sp. 139]